MSVAEEMEWEQALRDSGTPNVGYVLLDRPFVHILAFDALVKCGWPALAQHLKECETCRKKLFDELLAHVPDGPAGGAGL